MAHPSALKSLVLASLLLLSNSVVAQDEDSFQANELRKRAAILADDVLAIQQRLFPPSPLFGGPSLVSDRHWLMNLVAVRGELRLNTDQALKMELIESDFDSSREKVVEEFDKLNAMEPGEEFVKAKNRLHKQIDDNNATRQQAYNETLSESQQTRLRQIEFQMNRVTRGEFDFINEPDMRRLLGIDDQQRDKLSRRSEELEAEFRKKYLELVQETRQAMLSELSDDQQKKINELAGEEFDLSKLRPLNNENK